MPSGRLLVRRIAFWSLLALVAVYLDLSIGASRGLAHDIERIRQRGEPIDVDAWRTSPTTDEQRRAAELYAAAGERSQEVGREEGFRFPSIDVDRSAPIVNVEELESTYRNDAPALQLLDQATPLDFGGFGTAGRTLYAHPRSQLAQRAECASRGSPRPARRRRCRGARPRRVGPPPAHHAVTVLGLYGTEQGRWGVSASCCVIPRPASLAGGPAAGLRGTAGRRRHDPGDHAGAARDSRVARRRRVAASPRRVAGSRCSGPLVNRFARQQLVLFDEVARRLASAVAGRVDAADRAQAPLSRRPSR